MSRFDDELMNNRIILFLCVLLLMVGTANGAQLTQEYGDQTSTDTNQAGFIYWQQLNTTFSGNSITVSINVQTPVGNARIAIYNSSGSNPVALLNETASTALVSGWNNISLVYNITAGNEYWLATQMDNAANVNYRNASTTLTLKFAAQAYGAFPATAPAMTWASRNLNTRITVETPVNNIPIYDSYVLQYLDYPENTSASAVYVKLKNITLLDNYTGSFNTSFTNLYGGGGIVNGRIYLNGNAYGTEHTLVFPGNLYYNDSFSFSSLRKGDEIAVYGHADGGIGHDVRVYDFRITFTYDYINATPSLTYPYNTSTLSFTFPPQIDDVNFSWLPIGSSGYQIMVAKDSNFNIMVADTTTTNNYSMHSLDAATYYWKVRTYNDAGATLGNWSDVFTFTHASTTASLTGVNINGVVYTMSGSTVTPLSGANVYLYNNTATMGTITGSNGYFLFTGLANGSVYYLKAALKDYQASEIYNVNTSGTTTQNIVLKPAEPAWFEADKQYVNFKTRWLFCLFDCDVSGVTLTVYKYGEASPAVIGSETNPKITDSSGSVSFLLFKTQRYTITVVNGTQGINQDMTIYPTDNSYIILISNTETPFQTHPMLEIDAINTTVSKSIVNSTYTNIDVSYNDSLGQTINMTVYFNQSNVTLATTSFIGNGTHSFNTTGYSGQEYTVHFLGNHTTYGVIDYTYVVKFDKTSVGTRGIPEELWLWFAVAIMFFTAAIFTASTAEIGMMVVCAEGWIFLALGMFSTINTVSFGIGLTLVSVLSIMAYMNAAKKKEGYT